MTKTFHVTVVSIYHNDLERTRIIACNLGSIIRGHEFIKWFLVLRFGSHPKGLLIFGFIYQIYSVEISALFSKRSSW